MYKSPQDIIRKKFRNRHWRPCEVMLTLENGTHARKAYLRFVKNGVVYVFENYPDVVERDSADLWERLQRKRLVQFVGLLSDAIKRFEPIHYNEHLKALWEVAQAEFASLERADRRWWNIKCRRKRISRVAKGRRPRVKARRLKCHRRRNVVAKARRKPHRA